MNIELVTIVGVLTTVTAILVKILGLPDQVRKNYLRKSTDGLSVIFFGLGLLSYTLWTFYGALKGDWVLIIGQGVGVITMGIIALQIYKYRKKKVTAKVEMHRLREALEASWKRDTAYQYVHERGNPALGQCYPTSRVVQHYFPDAKVVKGKVWTGKSEETHFWNTLSIKDSVYHIDFSWNQFPPGSTVKSFRPLTKDELSDSGATVKRVELLQQRVQAYLSKP